MSKNNLDVLTTVAGIVAAGANAIATGGTDGNLWSIVCSFGIGVLGWLTNKSVAR